MEAKSVVLIVLLIVLVLVGVALAQQKKCCYPDQFVIKEGTQTGLDENGKGFSVYTDSAIAFDKTNKRLGSLTGVFYERNFTFVQLIQDYNTGVEYTIEKKLQKCQKRPLTGEYPGCVPDEATFEGSVYLGNHKMTVDSFSLSVKEKGVVGQSSLTVTSPECIPNSFSFAGTVGDVPMLSVAGFYNYTAGISDPSTFFAVPSFCPQSFTEEPKMHSLFDPKLMR